MDAAYWTASSGAVAVGVGVGFVAVSNVAASNGAASDVVGGFVVVSYVVVASYVAVAGDAVSVAFAKRSSGSRDSWPPRRWVGAERTCSGFEPASSWKERVAHLSPPHLSECTLHALCLAAEEKTVR